MRRSTSHAIGATVSIGAAVSHEPVTAIDGLIARTDAALYRAKHAGRNRVHIAEEDIANDRTRMIAAVRRARQVPAEGLLPLSQRNTLLRSRRLAAGWPRSQPLIYSCGRYHAPMWRSPDSS